MTYERKKYYLKEILIDLNQTHTYSERNTFRYCIHTFANKYLYAFSHQTFAVEKIPIFFDTYYSSCIECAAAFITLSFRSIVYLRTCNLNRSK